MNKITKAEREALIISAIVLLRQGCGQRDAEKLLQITRGVSKDRAKAAVAKAILRRNKPA